MHNRAFYRALHSILHPITIGAIVVLLLNDHFLKRHYPSWWTGKLSDFAGLISAPLIFAAFLAWIIPPRLKNQENWVGIIAFSVTGIIFALTKTLTQANDVTSKFWEFFAGGPVKMWLDPTDLLALPALIIGRLIWSSCTNKFDGHVAPASGMMILACLSALASTPGGADYGIVCVAVDEDTLIGWSGHSDSDGYLGTSGKAYTVDSSLTSSERSINNVQECNQWLANVQQSPVWELTNPNEPNQIYRFTFGQSIEVSENAGRDWLTAIDLENIATEKRMRAKDRTNIWTGFVAEPGPLDAVFDPSGNKLYVAMGLDGILVIQTDKNPIWVSIGDYQFDEPDEIDIRFFELWPHLGMGIGAAFLTMLIVNPKTPRRKATIALYIVCALVWVILLISIEPVPYMRTLDQFDLGIAPIGMAAIFPFALVALAESKHRQQIKLKSAARMKYTLMATTLLVSILPFYVWQILDDTTTYAIATYSSIGLVLTVQAITLKLSSLSKTETTPE